jgi:diguanylate cyclase (GGDEF)-like protein/PAS domain S-box-containing protein
LLKKLLSRFHLDSLRSRLLLLVLLAMVPPLILNVVGAWHQREREVRAAKEDLQRMAHLAAANEERFIDGGRQLLMTLADVPEVRRDSASCSAFLQRLLSKNEDYFNLGLVQLNGDISCSAVALPKTINVKDRDYFQRAVKERKFIVSDYVFGRMLGQHMITLAYPLQDDSGRVEAVLFAAIKLGALDRFVRDIHLPPDAVLITADRNGTVLSQRPSLDQQLRIGEPVARHLLAAMRAEIARIIEFSDTDDVERLHAFAPVNLGDTSRFMLSIGMSRQSIVASANRQQAIELLMLLLTAGLALLATALIGDAMILRRVKTLVRTVARMSAGDLGARSGMRGGTELDQLAQAIDNMAQSLQQHDSERNAAQASLFEEKERAEVTLASIGDAVITTDRVGRVEYMNRIAETLTGWKNAAAKNQPLNRVFRVLNQHSRQPVQNPVEQALRQGKIVTLDKETLLIGGNGTEYAVEDSAAPIRDRERNIIGAVLVFRDVSQSRHLAQQLSYQASHDPLTGLVNRREFEHRMQLALNTLEAKGQLRHYSLLYMDLDQFKIVNDTCGHSAGDDLLCQVTARLQPLLRESDTLARLGGDEFGALLENCTPAAAARIADKLRQTICDFHFVWGEQTFSIGVSIGMISFDTAALGMAELLAAADSACYSAKNRGRNRVQIYDPDEVQVVRRSEALE